MHQARRYEGEEGLDCREGQLLVRNAMPIHALIAEDEENLVALLFLKGGRHLAPAR